jgi:hypothetical protein
VNEVLFELAVRIRQLFRHHCGDTGHGDLGDRVVEHPADAAVLRFVAP